MEVQSRMDLVKTSNALALCNNVQADEFDSVSPGMDWKTRMYQIDVSLMLNLSRGECTLVSRCHLACAGLN